MNAIPGASWRLAGNEAQPPWPTVIGAAGPPNATPEPVATAVVHLARTRYAEANHTHLSELLSERERIDIGRSTLRRIPVNAGLSSPRSRRPPQRRVRRQRMPREGMLIQVDGSHHPWLGDQAPPFTLLIAVDDATGTVVDALFCQQEDAHSYFLLSRACQLGHGALAGRQVQPQPFRTGLRFDGGGADRCLAQVFPVFAGGPPG